MSIIISFVVIISLVNIGPPKDTTVLRCSHPAVSRNLDQVIGASCGLPVQPRCASRGTTLWPH